MTPRRVQSVTVPQSLGQLRLRLTAWYVGTFLAVLSLVGIGLFASITRRFDNDLDASLRDAARALAGAARTRAPDSVAAYLIIPDRRLLVFDSTGRPLSESDVEPWLHRFAERAADGPRAIGHNAAPERILRAYAEPFRTANGRPLVAVAVADEIELEDKYAALIAASVTAALLALVLVGIGGWLMAGRSIKPVEHTVAHMRRFMADAAHELRTPLSVMRSRAEVTLERPRTREEYEETLRGIERETIRVARIVDDLLTLARADAGERPTERQRVFLDDIALDATDAARALADRKGVKVEVAEFEEAPVVADPSLLHQLVLILVDNAIKFSDAGSRVSVGVQSGASAATLVVADQGAGIPADQLPHIFERFYRGDAARTRTSAGVFNGAGLGLSIAQWIIQEHGATVRVESQTGQGTRVTVQFPSAPPESV